MALTESDPQRGDVRACSVCEGRGDRLGESPDRLNDILCWRDERYVGQQLTFSYERKRIMLEESKV